MEKDKIISEEQQFREVVDIILQHKSRASKAVNKELLLTAWHVGGYVSGKLKSEEWGSKVVTQLSEYIGHSILILKDLGGAVFIIWCFFMMSILRLHLLRLLRNI